MTTRPFANAVMYSFFSEGHTVVVHMVAPDRDIDWWQARIFYVEDGRLVGGDMITAMWEDVAYIAAMHECIDMPERPPHEA
jgi:hypothetical protein